MHCPACDGVMVVIEYEKIEVDYCTVCYGVSFDAGELGLLLESLSIQESDLNSRKVTASEAKASIEKKRKCPICRKKMNKLYLGAKPQVIIDSCVIGHGLWFDGGELDQILKQHRKGDHETDDHNKVVHFLGDIFKARE
ncbi:MAG: zf-TFIIB domain-containing protein [Chloroflexi bacterium]|nr:zf-TFIIB domain-containing protein [Chloroflexota bacterium]